jgi:hypothetical protein
MSNDHSSDPRISPDRRLLEAMVTLNAINHGRPVPDMSKIQSGFTFAVTPTMDRDQIRRNLVAALKKAGITVQDSA